MPKKKEIDASDAQITFDEEAPSVTEWICTEMKRWIQAQSGMEVDVWLEEDDQRA